MEVDSSSQSDNGHASKKKSRAPIAVAPALRFQHFILSPFVPLAFVSMLFASLWVHLTACLSFAVIRFSEFLLGDFRFEDFALS